MEFTQCQMTQQDGQNNNLCFKYFNFSSEVLTLVLLIKYYVKCFDVTVGDGLLVITVLVFPALVFVIFGKMMQLEVKSTIDK